MNLTATLELPYYDLKGITNNKILVVLKGDRDKSDYVCQFHKLIDKGVDNGGYAPTNDTTLENLKFLHNFLCRDIQTLKL